MSKFKVQVSSEDGTEIYTVFNNSHDDTSIGAAQKALRSYAEHGHGRFPYNDGRLSIVVEPVDLDSDDDASSEGQAS